MATVASNLFLSVTGVAPSLPSSRKHWPLWLLLAASQVPIAPAGPRLGRELLLLLLRRDSARNWRVVLLLRLLLLRLGCRTAPRCREIDRLGSHAAAIVRWRRTWNKVCRHGVMMQLLVGHREGSSVGAHHRDVLRLRLLLLLLGMLVLLLLGQHLVLLLLRQHRHESGMWRTGKHVVLLLWRGRHHVVLLLLRRRGVGCVLQHLGGRSSIPWHVPVRWTGRL